MLGLGQELRSSGDVTSDFNYLGWGIEFTCSLVIIWFLFGEVSSSSGCLGWATFFIVALPEPSL